MQVGIASLSHWNRLKTALVPRLQGQLGVGGGGHSQTRPHRWASRVPQGPISWYTRGGGGCENNENSSYRLLCQGVLFGVRAPGSCCVQHVDPAQPWASKEISQIALPFTGPCRQDMSEMAQSPPQSLCSACPELETGYRKARRNPSSSRVTVARWPWLPLSPQGSSFPAVLGGS